MNQEQHLFHLASLIIERNAYQEALITISQMTAMSSLEIPKAVYDLAVNALLLRGKE